MGHTCWQHACAHTYTQVRLYINNVTALDVPRLRRIFAERANQPESSIGLPKFAALFVCVVLWGCTLHSVNCTLLSRTSYNVRRIVNCIVARRTADARAEASPPEIFVVDSTGSPGCGPGIFWR